MKKIVYLPLDERPCNYNFPYKLFNNDDLNIIRPDISIMGDKKKPGNYEKIAQFLLEETKDAYGLVISIDTLLYGGIVPSRLHYHSVETLSERLNIIKQIKAHNPSLKIFAFHLIMRCPQYSLSDEEPDYYDECGLEIFKYGYIKHKMELKIATEEEIATFNSLKIKQEYLDDFLTRRKINVAMNLKTLEYVIDHTIDFLIIPQDDAAVYGWTAMDQKVIRSQIEKDRLQLRAYMYPGADEVGNTLISRMLNEIKGKRPLVYIKYAVCSAPTTIPVLEDRFLDTTIKYHIVASGGLVVSSIDEADIILCVNAPADVMISAPHQFETKGAGFTTQRNLVEFIEFLDYIINVKKKPAILADVAFGNGGDLELITLVEQKGLIMKLAAYAGWNTSSNSLGTCIPHGFRYLIYGNDTVHKDFLVHRYIEDLGYCSVVRRYITENYLQDLGFNYFYVKEQRGIVSELAKSELEKFIKDYLPSLVGKVKFNDVYMPWRRMFEIGLDVQYTG